jgi:hypothetical protein
MGARRSGTALDLESYLRLTRGVTVSIAYLLPLLCAYELGVAWIGSDLRNSAELSLKQIAGLFGVYAVWVQRAVLVVVMVVAVRLARRDVPALRLYPVFLLEATLLALLLGPIVSLLVGTVGLHASAPLLQAAAGAAAEGATQRAVTQRALLSIGAGVYEELVFRFLLLAGGFAFLHKGLAVPKRVAFGVALTVSALLFAAYHHVGPSGEPFDAATFLFRTGAGAILGLVFAGRGLALCAYLHAFYDIFCDLHAAGAAT